MFLFNDPDQTQWDQDYYDEHLPLFLIWMRWFSFLIKYFLRKIFYLGRKSIYKMFPWAARIFFTNQCLMVYILILQWDSLQQLPIFLWPSNFYGVFLCCCFSPPMLLFSQWSGKSLVCAEISFFQAGNTAVVHMHINQLQGLKRI